MLSVTLRSDCAYARHACVDKQMLVRRSQAQTAPAESAMTGYLWFPEETELWLLQAALQLLRPLTPLPFSKFLPQSVAHGSFQPAGGSPACCAMTLPQMHLFGYARTGRYLHQVLLVGRAAPIL